VAPELVVLGEAGQPPGDPQAVRIVSLAQLPDERGRVRADLGAPGGRLRG